MTFTDNQRSGTKKMLAKLKPKMIMFSLPAAASNSDCRRSHPDCPAIDAGSLRRVPAAEVEALIGQAVRERLKGLAPAEDKDLIRTHVFRVDVQADHLVIELRAAKKEPPLRREDGTSPSHERCQLEADRIVLHAPWKKPPSKRRREIIVPQSAAPQDARPIRAETRATLVASIARGRRWLDEIVAGATIVEQIAAREGCSIRQVNMTISLAFLRPGWCRRPSKGDCPGYWRYSSPRCACRVVPPICDA